MENRTIFSMEFAGSVKKAEPCDRDKLGGQVKLKRQSADARQCKKPRLFLKEGDNQA